MSNRFRRWVHKNFGKLDKPLELDALLIGVTALLIVMFFILIKILMATS